MYGQSLNEFGQLPAAAKPELSTTVHVGSGESINNLTNVSYGALEDFETIEVDNNPPSNDVVYDGDGDGSHPPLPRGDSSDQLTLSFRGQVYVFDNVTADKMQNVFLVLGGCEFPGNTQGGVELVYQNPRDLDYPIRCSHPHRAASLSRFRQKRKERCFEKKIRYNVRQEVALRMIRKKGQFTSSKNSDESGSWNTGEAEDSGQDDSPTETLCAHCGINSKSTPMMRRGPAGPRTLCNACGLFWANRGMLRDLSKKFNDNTSTPTQQDEYDGSSYGNPMPRGTNLIPYSNNDSSGLVAEQ